MSAHTPGPWRVNQIVRNPDLKPVDRRGYAGDMAYVGTDRPYPRGMCIAVVREECIAEIEANARLIAKAPELLEMLREFAQPAPDPDPQEHIFQRHVRVRRKLDQLTQDARALLAEIEGADA